MKRVPEEFRPYCLPPGMTVFYGRVGRRRGVCGGDKPGQGRGFCVRIKSRGIKHYRTFPAGEAPDGIQQAYSRAAAFWSGIMRTCPEKRLHYLMGSSKVPRSGVPGLLKIHRSDKDSPLWCAAYSEGQQRKRQKFGSRAEALRFLFTRHEKRTGHPIPEDLVRWALENDLST